MSTFIDFVLHINDHMVNLVTNFGDWTYLILFLIIFVETGAVILPFLPGDSLLFAASAIAADSRYGLNIFAFFALFLFACVAGDSLNFYLGKHTEQLLSRYQWFSRFISQESLAKGRHFFEKYGALSIILARFMPIIRTFVPFVAAGSGFEYKQFLRYNLIGCVAWVTLCCGAGYFFGNIPFVKEHFSMVVIGIIVVSLLPAVIGFIKSRVSRNKN